MPWSHFTKGAFSGSSRAVFGRFMAVPHGPGGTPTGRCPILHHVRPRVTFNTNLKVTRAPARNIPRFKPRNLPGRNSACPLPGSARDTGTIFEEKLTRIPTRPPPLRDPGRSLRGPDLACRGPGRCSVDAFTLSERVLVRTLVGTLVQSPGGYTATERRIYQCSINQSINKSSKQFRLLLNLQTVFVT